MNQAEHMTADPRMVDAITDWLRQAVEIGTQVGITVPANEFSAWLAAMAQFRDSGPGVPVPMHAMRHKDGRVSVFAGAVLRSVRWGRVHVQVACRDEPPAPWVRFPERGEEATRRYVPTVMIEPW
jgi:hypothetical protein